MADRCRRGPLLALMVTSLLLGRPAAATVVLPMDFDTQCASAARIFVGTVRAVESRRNPAAPRYFETLVRFAVDEVVAGDAEAEITLRFAGGTIGDERQSIDGMPEFRVGERYVVLADRDDDSPLVSPLVGFNQGLYRVVPAPGAPSETAAARARLLVRDRAGRPLAGTTAAAGEVAAEPGGDGPTLADFLAAVRAARQ